MAECVVKKYCLSAETRGMCRKCREYDKFERKKSKSRQAIGRSNKRRGKDSEKKLLLHFQRHSLDARIIEGSGAYKKVREGADSDLRVTIYGVERKVENKKRQSFDRIRKLIGEKTILYITGFCFVMNENIFYDLVKHDKEIVDSRTVHSGSGETYAIREVSDRNYGELHKFFEQDYADIVSLDQSYCDFMFALQPDFFREIVNTNALLKKIINFY